MENKKMTRLVAQKKYQLFSNVKVSSVSHGKIKSIMGFEVDAQLFLLNDILVLTSKEMSIKLFQTTLPLLLENKKGKISKIKLTSWNSLQIIFQKYTFSLGETTIELTIDSSNTESLLTIFEEIKHWN